MMNFGEEREMYIELWKFHLLFLMQIFFFSSHKFSYLSGDGIFFLRIVATKYRIKINS